MNFTLSWLKEHLSTTATAGDISNSLLQLGHENRVSTKLEDLSQFKVAKVLGVELHPNADRLNLCRIQSHDRILEIVCGAPNVRAGIHVALAEVGQVIPSNGMEIKEVKIRGQLSQGMICSAAELDVGDEEDGIMELNQDAKIGEPFFRFLPAAEDEPLFLLAITPNRGDCFGVRGIARDLAAAAVGELIPLDQVFRKRSIHKQFNEAGFPDFPLHIEDPGACPRFSYRLIRGIQNGKSPHWLRERLRISKVRSINKAVDATNFFLYDVNRPFHAFNLKSLVDRLVVTRAKGGEEFNGLDKETYSLPAAAMVIRDSEKIVSLAGIMGSIESGTYNETEDLLLESAYFHPWDIASAGQKLAINTHSRARFERGVDRDFCGLDALTQMILNLCGGEASAVKVQSTPVERKIISFPKDCVQKVTGLNTEHEKILHALGFESVESGFTVPTWRHDCNNPNDLVEEVARVVGYSNISSLPMKKDGKYHSHRHPGIEQIVRQVCVQRGMWESVTYCFVHPLQAKAYGAEKPVLLSNPMHAEMNALRPSILPSLVESLGRNTSFGCGELNLFEVGTLYFGQNGSVQEKKCVAGIRFGGKPQDWQGEHPKASPFHVKHDALALAKACGVKDCEIRSTIPQWYENGQSLVVRGNVVASFGKLKSSLTNRLPVMAFEVFLDALIPTRGTIVKRYQPYKLQPVVRDLAFVVKEEITAEQVLDAVDVDEKTAALIIRKEVFDLYRGTGVDPGCKSIGIRLHMLNREKSFTQDEIDRIVLKIEQRVCATTSGRMKEPA